MQKQKYTFNVNGLEIEAEYDSDNVEHIFIPLLKQLSQLQQTKQRRIFVFMAAFAGCGKTTLSLFLQHLSILNDDLTNVQAVGIDGFHYPNTYLQTHYLFEDNEQILMGKRKGSAKTFDVKKLEQLLEQSRKDNVMWPVYSREIHDVIDAQQLVDQEIIILEGNYLLLDDLEWKQLEKYCDFSIFIDVENMSMLKERLIARKIKGGSSRAEAEAFYMKSDVKNIMKIKESRKADLMLSIDKNNHFTKVEMNERRSNENK